MKGSVSAPSICIGVLCHNEEQRIAGCLESLLPQARGVPIHVIVNGSTDRTAEVARAVSASNIIVHEFAEGGKSRSWNRFVFDTLEAFADVHIFIDGDTQVVPGSIAALADALQRDHYANLASAVPRSGRKAASYRAQMRVRRDVFGALYAVKGDLLERMKARAIRLPEDLIGDDGLLGAMAKTDLENESRWDDARVVVCEEAGFLCETVALTDLGTLRMQYRRMISYSMRHFQNLIISQIMRDAGPVGLPRHLSSLYPDHQDRLIPRRGLLMRYFDRMAIARMREDIDRAA
jgi:cellulose synthase/poly-beta-1,6-N-acetylglucosamine synthase-like glycosyltransferase